MTSQIFPGTPKHHSNLLPCFKTDLAPFNVIIPLRHCSFITVKYHAQNIAMTWALLSFLTSSASTPSQIWHSRNPDYSQFSEYTIQFYWSLMHFFPPINLAIFLWMGKLFTVLKIHFKHPSYRNTFLISFLILPEF